MSSLACGDVIEVKPMTFADEIVFGQRPSCAVEIHFDPGVSFTGYPSVGSNLPAVWIHGARLHFYGGDVTNQANDCVRIQAGSADTAAVNDIRWWGATIHDCGAQGLSVQGSGYPNTNLDIAADVSRSGQQLSLDPHAIDGTGLHGAYLGGGQTVSSGQFELTVHDQPTGYGVQIGANLQNSQLWIRASNITGTYGATDQSGAAVAMWGGNDTNVQIKDLEVSNVARHVLVTTSLSQPSSNLAVTYARATGIGAYPAYGSYSGLSYGDVQPASFG